MAAPSPVPDVPGRRSLTWLFSVFAGGNLFALVLRILSGLLAAKLVEPEILGLFNGIGLVNAWMIFLPFGVTLGLTRELPYWLGRGEHERAAGLASTALVVVVAMAGLVGAALVVQALRYLILGDLMRAAGWGSFAIIAPLVVLRLYLNAIYRNYDDFARLASTRVVETVLSLVLVLFVWAFGFYGLCIRGIGAIVGSMALLWYWRPLRVSPRWDRERYRELMGTGLPIFATSRIQDGWLAGNHTLVRWWAGAEGYGLWSVALMAEAALFQLPSAFYQILLPRMAARYGKDRSIRGLAAIAVKPTLLLVGLMVVGIPIAWFAIPPFFELVLPKYADAVPAARWAVIAAAVMAPTPFGAVFTVIKRQRLLAVGLCGGVLTWGGVLLALGAPDVTLVAFAQALAAGRLVHVVLVLGILGLLVRRER